MNGADLVQERKDLIAKCNDEPNFKLTRVDMTSPDKITKVRKYRFTADANYASIHADDYLKLRRDFFSIMESQKILTDLLFNYHKNKGTNLLLKDSYGPYDFGKKKLDDNPYGLSMADCEREANTVLHAMICGGPVSIRLMKIEQKSHPILNLFGYYDRIFFANDEDKVDQYRNAYIKMTFDDTKAPVDMLSEMQAAKSTWEVARGYFHEPHEDVQFLIDALKNGNMIKHFRGVLKDARKAWTEDGKGMVNSEQKARFTESDVDDFAMTISDHYNQLLKDDHIPAPIRKMPALGAHAHAASLSEDNYEDMANAFGVTPQAFLSMMNTRSGNNSIQNDNPSVEQTNTDRTGKQIFVPRDMRRNQQAKPKDTNSGSRSSASGHGQSQSQPQTEQKRSKPDYNDDVECRRRDEERAKKEGLAQSIACRRKIVDASGVLVNCHGEHLSNHCDRAPKVNLARLHPMHPFQENSPVESLNDWVHFTSGLKEYEGHPSFDDVALPAENHFSSSGASGSIPSCSDVMAIVFALFAVGIWCTRIW